MPARPMAEPNYLVLDFETASLVDLKVVGAEVYSQHPTTEILCLVYTVFGEKKLWVPGDPALGLRGAAQHPDVVFVAHNALFERAIWRNIMVPRFGFKDIPIERWHCTQAAAAWRALPLKLEHGNKVLGLEHQKDMEGSRITVAMSRPKKGIMVRSPELLQRVYTYCESDIDAEVDQFKRIGLLSTYERPIWELDALVNDRGVRVDLDFVRQAQLVAERASAPLMAEFEAMTGLDSANKVAKIVAWCIDQGFDVGSLGKDNLKALLGGSIDDDEEDTGGDPVSAYERVFGTPMLGNENIPMRGLPERVRRVLEIRRVLGSSSIKKLRRIPLCVAADGRVHGLEQYHGAITGRWTGRLFQPHNFPRGSLRLGNKSPPPQMVVDAIMTGDPAIVELVLNAPPIECIISSLRHTIVPAPGQLFGCGDFAGIEARIVLALAGQHDKTAMMASGVDVYLDMADDIYKHPKGTLTKADIAERTIGKNTVLGCGFQMGWETFKGRYCQHQTDEFAQGVIQTYRTVWAPRVPKLWYALEAAALEAVRDGRPHEAYGVVYRVWDDWMTARLPSGQTLFYFRPRFEPEGGKFGQDCWSFWAQHNSRWQNIQAYGGLLTENVVQALARGLLYEAMVRFENHGWPVVLTVHDEVLIETKSPDVKTMKEIMCYRSPWATAMKVPIDADVWVGDRYKKG